MIKPVYRQQYSRTGDLNETLRTALSWWLDVLSSGFAEERPWKPPSSSIVRMFVDAASTPAHIAAVVCLDGVLHYTNAAPAAEWVSKLRQGREDNQIMSLELLAIVLGLASFKKEVEGRKLVLYSDNKGAELSTGRGSAKAADHNAIVHSIWTMAFQYGVHLWLERVPSIDNISDSPSRGDHALLAELKAQWRAPCWDLS